jgi:TM2 domain-containing membrane protein YozV
MYILLCIDLSCDIKGNCLFFWFLILIWIGYIHLPIFSSCYLDEAVIGCIIKTISQSLLLVHPNTWFPPSETSV